jgi:hypothetical protein
MAITAQQILDEMRRQREERLVQRVADATHDLAMQGLDYITNISPVGEHGGTFKAGWHVVDHAPRREGDAPMSQIRNDTEGAVSIEYGTKDTPPHPTLAPTKVFLDQLTSKDIHI